MEAAEAGREKFSLCRGLLLRICVRSPLEMSAQSQDVAAACMRRGTRALVRELINGAESSCVLKHSPLPATKCSCLTGPETNCQGSLRKLRDPVWYNTRPKWQNLCKKEKKHTKHFRCCASAGLTMWKTSEMLKGSEKPNISEDRMAPVAPG